MKYKTLMLTVFMAIGCMSNATEPKPQAAAGPFNAIPWVIGGALTLSTLKTAAHWGIYKYHQMSLDDVNRNGAYFPSYHEKASFDEDTTPIHKRASKENSRNMIEAIEEDDNTHVWKAYMQQCADKQNKKYWSSLNLSVFLAGGLGVCLLANNSNNKVTPVSKP